MKVKGTELTASIKDAHNTFDNPDHVAPKAYQAFSVDGTTVKAKLSPMSVTVLELVSE
ncbi:Intracellular exo-alpha-L-arabinofuranosidase 2 [compost metagenome]